MPSVNASIDASKASWLKPNQLNHLSLLAASTSRWHSPTTAVSIVATFVCASAVVHSRFDAVSMQHEAHRHRGLIKRDRDPTATSRRKRADAIDAAVGHALCAYWAHCSCMLIMLVYMTGTLLTWRVDPLGRGKPMTVLESTICVLVRDTSAWSSCGELCLNAAVLLLIWDETVFSNSMRGNSIGGNTNANSMWTALRCYRASASGVRDALKPLTAVCSCAVACYLVAASSSTCILSAEESASRPGDTAGTMLVVNWVFLALQAALHAFRYAHTRARKLRTGEILFALTENFMVDASMSDPREANPVRSGDNHLLEDDIDAYGHGRVSARGAVRGVEVSNETRGNLYNARISQLMQVDMGEEAALTISTKGVSGHGYTMCLLAALVLRSTAWFAGNSYHGRLSLLVEVLGLSLVYMRAVVRTHRDWASQMGLLIQEAYGILPQRVDAWQRSIGRSITQVSRLVLSEIEPQQYDEGNEQHCQQQKDSVDLSNCVRTAAAYASSAFDASLEDRIRSTKCEVSEEERVLFYTTLVGGMMLRIGKGASEFLILTTIVRLSIGEHMGSASQDLRDSSHFSLSYTSMYEFLRTVELSCLLVPLLELSANAMRGSSKPKRLLAYLIVMVMLWVAEEYVPGKHVSNPCFRVLVVLLQISVYVEQHRPERKMLVHVKDILFGDESADTDCELQAMPSDFISVIVAVLVFIGFNVSILYVSILNFKQYQDPCDTMACKAGVETALEGFQDTLTSINSLFGLLTVVNYPDCMIPSYQAIGFWNLVFFVPFIVVGVLFITNVCFGIVCARFGEFLEADEAKRAQHQNMLLREAFRRLGEPQEIRNADADQLVVSLPRWREFMHNLRLMHYSHLPQHTDESIFRYSSSGMHPLNEAQFRRSIHVVLANSWGPSLKANSPGTRRFLAAARISNYVSFAITLALASSKLDVAVNHNFSLPPGSNDLYTKLYGITPSEEHIFHAFAVVNAGMWIGELIARNRLLPGGIQLHKLGIGTWVDIVATIALSFLCLFMAVTGSMHGTKIRKLTIKVVAPIHVLCCLKAIVHILDDIGSIGACARKSRVRALLKKLDMTDVLPVLEENGMDTIKCLQRLTPVQMEELGLSLAQQQRLEFWATCARSSQRGHCERCLSAFSLIEKMSSLKAPLVSVLASVTTLLRVIFMVSYVYATVGSSWLGELSVNSTIVHQSPYGKANYFGEIGFETLGSSFVTLFALANMNNWHVVMSGFIADRSESLHIVLVECFFISYVMLVSILLMSMLQSLLFYSFEHRHHKDKELLKLEQQIGYTATRWSEQYHLRHSESTSAIPIQTEELSLHFELLSPEPEQRDHDTLVRDENRLKALRQEIVELETRIARAKEATDVAL